MRVNVVGVWMAVAAAAFAACGTRDPATRAGQEEHQEEEQGATVTLTEAQFTAARIELDTVRTSHASGPGSALEVPGQVEFDPRRVAFISPRVAGRVERVLAVEGDRVRAGEAVAALYTPAHLTAQNDLLQARRRAEILASTPDAAGGQALLAAARQRLLTLGMSKADIDTLELSGQIQQELLLRAPFDGSILDVHVLRGAAVEASDSAFKLADLSAVDVIADVPERALPLVRLNQRASITLAAYPGTRFDGHVERLRDQLDPVTRTVRAAIHVPNPAGRLRPGMFATVTLAVPLREVAGTQPGEVVLTIPESAVVTDGPGRFVFVETGPRTYEKREVRVTSLEPPGSTVPSSDRVAVTEGLAAGERVVVRGAFTLKSELAKASLGEHGH